MWGGYRLYEKINWDKNVITNLSPYSSFKKILNIDNSKSKQSSDRLWLKAYNKYRKFLNVKGLKFKHHYLLIILFKVYLFIISRGIFYPEKMQLKLEIFL